MEQDRVMALEKGPLPHHLSTTGNLWILNKLLLIIYKLWSRQAFKEKNLEKMRWDISTSTYCFSSHVSILMSVETDEQTDGWMDKVAIYNQGLHSHSPNSPLVNIFKNWLTKNPFGENNWRMHFVLHFCCCLQ